MANPLDTMAPPIVKTDLREWCETQNSSKLAERMGRWYYVTEKDGSRLIDSLDGADGDNLRKMIDGALDDFHGWPPKRMQGYRRWLWNCATMGLTPETAERLGRPQLESAQ